MLLFSSKKVSFLITLWTYFVAKPIHHQEDQCLRLKVTVSGKISECHSLVGLLAASLSWAWSSDVGWLGSPTAQPTQHSHPSASLVYQVPDLRPPFQLTVLRPMPMHRRRDFQQVGGWSKLGLGHNRGSA